MFTRKRAKPPKPVRYSDLRALSLAQWKTLLLGNPDEVARWMRAAANAGLVEAQTTLGQMLLDGHGVAADLGEAWQWFRIAAEAGGYPPAMNMVGRCLERGWGVAVDHPQAGRWYAKAAAAGLDWAQYNLANMLLRGRGIDQDRPAAFDWFLCAAQQGHAKSMNLIGRFYEEGWDRPADGPAALAWYRAGAEAGDYRAQYNAGTIALRQDDLATAATWFQRALATSTADVLVAIAAALAPHSDPALRDIAEAARSRLERDD